MTDDELKQIRERLGESTIMRGRWEFENDKLMLKRDGYGDVYLGRIDEECNQGFIAHARQDVEKLLAYVDSLQAGRVLDEIMKPSGVLIVTKKGTDEKV